MIALLFILFAIFGPYAPGALKHGGTSWLGLVNHLYMTNQGIYGIAIGVMAQYVFPVHFIRSAGNAYRPRPIVH